MRNKTIALFVAALFVVSCAPPLRVSYFAGHRSYPPTPPASVDLLRHEPNRPHEAFAEIRYDPPAGMSRFDVERILREKGGEIGADALIIEVDNVFRDRVWVGPYRVHHRVYRERIIVAIAIRYH